MKLQTAVDYLLDQLPNKHELRYQLNQKGIIKKAKEMEQEQIRAEVDKVHDYYKRRR